MYESFDEFTVFERTKYEVASVEKIDAPEGLTGNDWYRYTIIFDGRSIEGMKQGSHYDIARHAEEFAENLNNRSSNFGGQPYRQWKK